MAHNRDELNRWRELYAQHPAAYFARRFAMLRDAYRRDDGSRWSNAALERATSGIVTARYASDLSRGRNHDPGAIKLWAISRVMAFDFDEWFMLKDHLLARLSRQH